MLHRFVLRRGFQPCHVIVKAEQNITAVHEDVEGRGVGACQDRRPFWLGVNGGQLVRVCVAAPTRDVGAQGANRLILVFLVELCDHVRRHTPFSLHYPDPQIPT